MAGQNHHFTQYAPALIDYAIDRYVNETARLYAVLNKRLADREFIAGDYSIADMACYPWIVPHERQRQDLDDFPSLKRWYETVAARPATVRAYAKGREINTTPTVTQEAKKLLFGQAAHTVGSIRNEECAAHRTAGQIAGLEQAIRLHGSMDGRVPAVLSHEGLGGMPDVEVRHQGS